VNATAVTAADAAAPAAPAPASPLPTLSWPPREDADADAPGSATDWLAPDDVDPANRRIIKTPLPPPASLPPAGTAGTSATAGDRAAGAGAYLVSDLDPDAADHLSLVPPSGGIETRPDELVPHSATIVPGQVLTSDHLVWILAQNNARDISVFHAPTAFGRVDAEWYVLATGLGLRHVHSLKDAIVHAVKQTMVPGLSSAAVAGGGKRRTPEHWEVIDLNDTVVHLMTEHGRELYDLEQLWTHGFTQEDLEAEEGDSR
jgi:ribosomal silencing factor RsfS